LKNINLMFCLIELKIKKQGISSSIFWE